MRAFATQGDEQLEIRSHPIELIGVALLAVLAVFTWKEELEHDRWVQLRLETQPLQVPLDLTLEMLPS